MKIVLDISIANFFCVFLFLISNIYCLKINSNVSNAKDTDENVPTSEPYQNHKYNNEILELNGTMRKYFAMEALMQESRNFVLSPLSAMLPIGKLYFGAKAIAKREIENSFGLRYADEIQQVLFNAISSMEKLDGIHLNIALFMLLPKFNEVTKEYKDKISKLFHYNLQHVNFEHKAQVADYTNYVFKVLTGGVTDKIVNPSEIESNSSLVVFNTCIFKGDWLVPFVNLDNFVFTSDLGKRKKVSGYRMTVPAKYISDDTLKVEIVQINFKTKAACFLVVLPYPNTDLKSVMATIKSDPLLLKKAITNMSTIKTQISLPKFQIENKVDLKDFYIKVGIKNIFDPLSSGLTRLLVREVPWVTSVRQVIKFRLRNMWVEGSADDVALLQYGDQDVRKKFPKVKLFNANRPFLFYVLHKGEQLFVGSVFDP